MPSGPTGRRQLTDQIGARSRPPDATVQAANETNTDNVASLYAFRPPAKTRWRQPGGLRSGPKATQRWQPRAGTAATGPVAAAGRPKPRLLASLARGCPAPRPTAHLDSLGSPCRGRLMNPWRCAASGVGRTTRSHRAEDGQRIARATTGASLPQAWRSWRRRLPSMPERGSTSLDRAARRARWVPRRKPGGLTLGLRQADLRPGTHHGEQPIRGERRQPLGGFQPVWCPELEAGAFVKAGEVASFDHGVGVILAY
jgi:hypothetical protein